MSTEKMLVDLVKSVDGLVKEVKVIKGTMGGLVNEIETINSTMATKDGIKNVATDLQRLETNVGGLETKIDGLETKVKENGNKIDLNYKQIAKNTEQLHELNSNSTRMEKIMETLSIRSIEQEGSIRNMTIPANYTPSK